MKGFVVNMRQRSEFTSRKGVDVLSGAKKAAMEMLTSNIQKELSLDEKEGTNEAKIRSSQIELITMLERLLEQDLRIKVFVLRFW